MSDSEERRAEVDPAQESVTPEMAVFYGGAIRRIERLCLILGIVLAIAVYFPWGIVGSAGAVLGALLAYRNFRVLVSSVNAVSERIIYGESKERGSIVVARFVGRIFLIAIVAYAIFRYSEIGLLGLLVGLCIPVAAMLCEAGFELSAFLRREL